MGRHMWDKIAQGITRVTSASGVATSLPPELLERAIRGFSALVFGLIGLPVLVVLLGLIAPRALGATTRTEALPLIVIGLLLYVLSVTMLVILRRGRIKPDAVLNLGLAYEVLFCFAVSLAELMRPNAPGTPLQGISFAAVLIVLFPMFIPGTLRKTLLIALTAATMGPLAALLYFLVRGEPLPGGGRVLLTYIPNYIVVGLVVRTTYTAGYLGRLMHPKERMGNYELQELLGEGGMGTVWRAQHRLLRRPAAVKLIRPEALGSSSISDSMGLVRRFEREAQATAELHSPHSIQLYDFGVTEERTLFYVMELLDGFDLKTLIVRFGPQPAERVTHLLAQACESLWDAHQSQLIHRDIKPGNLYICRYGHEVDFIKVLDFGLVKHTSKMAGDESGLTRAGSFPGTPAFMAPETASEGQTDLRADIYSLGCVGYWLLTGEMVFQRETPMQTILAHVQEDPPPPSQRTELEVPPELERIILACLEKDPAHRPQSAAELGARLRACECAAAWTAERAAAWWDLHHPPQAAS